MNILVIGSGYVGLVTGACFAELGNQVYCIDVNAEKIAQLNRGILPIYEPGLAEMVEHNYKAGRLQFHTSLNDVFVMPDVLFIAVGTPSNEDGAADVQYVLAAASDIGNYVTNDCVVVDKSTVPVGMAEQVGAIITKRLQERGISLHVDVVSNPEFLREGAAIDDFMKPDRVVIGTDSERAKKMMLDLYHPIMGSTERLFVMPVKAAELTKYAANAMLATRISFVNELSLLCDRLGVDVEDVRRGIGADARIGPLFLKAGCGYGGSCFPKDVRALIKMAEQQGIEPLLLRAVEERNNRQKLVLIDKIVEAFGEDLSSQTIALWGLAFKPGTDDMREASSLITIYEIMKRGGKVRVYDPAAMNQAQKMLPSAWSESSQIVWAEDPYHTLEQVDALVLVTEWKVFSYPDFVRMQAEMRGRLIIDGRNVYDPTQVRNAGFEYVGIGR